MTFVVFSERWGQDMQFGQMTGTKNTIYTSLKFKQGKMLPNGNKVSQLFQFSHSNFILTTKTTQV